MNFLRFPAWAAELPERWPIARRMPGGARDEIRRGLELVWRDGVFRGAVSASLVWIGVILFVLALLWGRPRVR